jgi:hypothetical protein
MAGLSVQVDVPDGAMPRRCISIRSQTSGKSGAPAESKRRARRRTCRTSGSSQAPAAGRSCPSRARLHTFNSLSVETIARNPSHLTSYAQSPRTGAARIAQALAEVAASQEPQVSRTLEGTYRAREPVLFTRLVRAAPAGREGAATAAAPRTLMTRADPQG